MRRNFRSLNFAGELHSILNGKKEFDMDSVINSIEESWQECPSELFDYISQKANGKTCNYRSLIWELFLWKSLNLANYKVAYEYRDSLSDKSIDFLVTGGQDYVFLMEATSIGPNDDNLFNYVKENDDYVTKRRESLHSKVPKLASGRNIASVLALSDSFSRFPNTVFDKIQLLYGRPAVRINTENSETSMVLADHGFWSSSYSQDAMFDAVLLGFGIFPGYSSSQRMQLWLNPESLNPLNIMEFPLDVDFYKTTASDVWMTNSLSGYEWKKISIYS
jgi:hypothetical protein